MRTKLTVTEINDKYIQEKCKFKEEFPPLTTPEDEIAIKRFYSDQIGRAHV